MHIPDGFIDAPTSLAFGVVAAAGIGYCLKRGSAELDERAAPLAGLTAAFVFAGQMLNFPVAAGTSGHLLGGVLAAVLVGPFTGALCLTVVLIVQGLLFADGGLTAIGTNIVLIALVTTFGGWALFRGAVRVLPRNRTGLLAAGGAAAFVSVPMAALVFVLLYVLGGVVDIDAGTLTVTMLAVHVLIGIGEALITVVVLSAVLSSRPDLVYGARHLSPGLTLRSRVASV